MSKSMKTQEDPEHIISQLKLQDNSPKNTLKNSLFSNSAELESFERQIKTRYKLPDDIKIPVDVFSMRKYMDDIGCKDGPKQSPEKTEIIYGLESIKLEGAVVLLDISFNVNGERRAWGKDSAADNYIRNFADYYRGIFMRTGKFTANYEIVKWGVVLGNKDYEMALYLFTYGKIHTYKIYEIMAGDQFTKHGEVSMPYAILDGRFTDYSRFYNHLAGAYNELGAKLSYNFTGISVMYLNDIDYEEFSQISDIVMSKKPPIFMKSEYSFNHNVLTKNKKFRFNLHHFVSAAMRLHGEELTNDYIHSRLTYPKTALTYMSKYEQLMDSHGYSAQNLVRARPKTRVVTKYIFITYRDGVVVPFELTYGSELEVIFGPDIDFYLYRFIVIHRDNYVMVEVTLISDNFINGMLENKTANFQLSREYIREYINKMEFAPKKHRRRLFAKLKEVFNISREISAVESPSEYEDDEEQTVMMIMVVIEQLAQYDKFYEEIKFDIPNIELISGSAKKHVMKVLCRRINIYLDENETPPARTTVGRLQKFAEQKNIKIELPKIADIKAKYRQTLIL